MDTIPEFTLAGLTTEQLEAIVKKLGGHDGALKFLGEDTTVTSPLPAPLQKWRKENGIIYFSVTSDGTTGKEWVKRLKQKGISVGDNAKRLLCSKRFKPTSGVTTEIALLKSAVLKVNNRITSAIRAFAAEHKLEAPNAEVVCLIRENLSDKEILAMGLTAIAVMHQPIKDSDGGLSLLSMSRSINGSWLGTYYGESNVRWDNLRRFAFAFAVAK